MALLSHFRYVAHYLFYDRFYTSFRALTRALTILSENSRHLFVRGEPILSQVCRALFKRFALIIRQAVDVLSPRSCFSPMSASVPDAPEFSCVESRRAKVAFQEAMFRTDDLYHQAGVRIIARPFPRPSRPSPAGACGSFDPRGRVRVRGPVGSGGNVAHVSPEGMGLFPSPVFPVRAFSVTNSRAIQSSEATISKRSWLETSRQ